jgi:glycosyltransferase involved in cell wall biosynthesis
LPLAKTAFLAAKKYQLKTVLDLHENYPAALKTWFSWRKNPIIRLKNTLFFSYNRWRNYEAKIIKKYDVLIAVVDEMKQRLVDQHQIDPGKIVIVPNAEKKDFAKNFETHLPDYFKEEKERFIISYVGGFGPHRGLHTAILGMKEISSTGVAAVSSFTTGTSANSCIVSVRLISLLLFNSAMAIPSNWTILCGPCRQSRSS